MNRASDLTARGDGEPPAGSPRPWTLIGADGRSFSSSQPGTLGGHRRTRIYGRLDCPSAQAAIARGGYTAHRVFFAAAETAVLAGYRPCARCLPEAYQSWKARQATRPRTESSE